jgi:hypothetical protein
MTSRLGNCLDGLLLDLGCSDELSRLSKPSVDKQSDGADSEREDDYEKEGEPTRMIRPWVIDRCSPSACGFAGGLQHRCDQFSTGVGIVEKHRARVPPTQGWAFD